MNVETAREYCVGKKAVSEGFPFDDTTLVFKVMDKMFAVIDLDSADKIVLKCDPDYAEELRDRYAGIAGARYFNKKYWNQVSFNADVDDRLIISLIDHSYGEVLKKFTRRKLAEYEAL